jgi:YesN/AraC family two-component response regulator
MGKKVLIVEDEAINAEALAMMIPLWGGVVAGIAPSGEAAIRAAETSKPDFVLMDINIHGAIGGIAAAREIIGRLGIPLVFMSGFDDEETVQAAMALKPLDFLVKPLDVDRLKELLRLG